MKIFVLIFLLLLIAPVNAAETTFAEIDASGTVLRVIVADQAFINSGKVGDPSRWKQTYSDGAVRKNYAGPGYTYDRTNDVFVPSKPFASWTLDNTVAQWKAPLPAPPDGKPYVWDEKNAVWAVDPKPDIIAPKN